MIDETIFDVFTTKRRKIMFFRSLLGNIHHYDEKELARVNCNEISRGIFIWFEPESIKVFKWDGKNRPVTIFITEDAGNRDMVTFLCPSCKSNTVNELWSENEVTTLLHESVDVMNERQCQECNHVKEKPRRCGECGSLIFFDDYMKRKKVTFGDAVFDWKYAHFIICDDCVQKINRGEHLG